MTKEARTKRLQDAASACDFGWTAQPDCWRKLANLADALVDVVKHDMPAALDNWAEIDRLG